MLGIEAAVCALQTQGRAISGCHFRRSGGRQRHADRCDYRRSDSHPHRAV